MRQQMKQQMSDEFRELLLAVAAVLQCPRNRFGKIEVTAYPRERMRKAASRLDLLDKLPHGGSDGVDQAAMFLQAATGIILPISIAD